MIEFRYRARRAFAACVYHLTHYLVSKVNWQALRDLHHLVASDYLGQ